MAYFGPKIQKLANFQKSINSRVIKAMTMKILGFFSRTGKNLKEI